MIFECHGHIILDGISYAGAVARHQNVADGDFIRKNFELCKENGITFYRDGGDRHGVSVFAKKIAGEYGIDYRTPAYIIHKKGHYGGMFGRAYGNIPEYRALISDAKQLGADFIKTTASGIMDFADRGAVTGSAMAAGELNEIINIAHGEGFPVMIHANGADSIKRAAESGADSIEHGFYMDTDALKMILDTGAVWVPTCATVFNLIGSGRYNDSIMRKIFADHCEALIAASVLGVPVACGSDAGAAGVPQGKGTIDESSILDSLRIDHANGSRKIEEVFKRRC